MKSATSSTSKAPPRSGSSGPQFLQLAAQMTLGWVGAFVFMLAQVLVLLSIRRRSVSSIWELQVGLLGLAPSWLLLALPPAILASALMRLLVLRPDRVSLNARLLAAALVGVAGGLVGWGVGGGRHLATLPLRGSFALLVACLSAVTTFLIARWSGHAKRSLRHDYLLIMALFLGGILVELINLSVLVRLYPAFHLGLSAFALTLVAAAAVGWGYKHEILQLKSFLTVCIHYSFPVILLLALGLVQPASQAVSGFDNFRFLVIEGPPSPAWGVELAARIAPPPSIDAGATQLPLGAPRVKSGDQLSFRGQTVLLISVDALRADHLGAYGYQRATSPAIDRLAQEGVRFNAAYAPTPHTSYSISSLMTGKYMRPLLLQGAGRDSELWATLLRTFGYKTAAFYPPAVFFIDRAHFKELERDKLGFEYAWVEFSEGAKRIAQVEKYLSNQKREEPLFLWVHLFGPHEPYEKDARFDFGESDEDRYDSEIRTADETVDQLVRLIRERDPNALVVLTADHGEEFGDHGGRYHGTSVYDEQVRVPLIVSSPDVEAGRVVHHPVQTIDILPTVLDGLEIMVPPRMRGNSFLNDLSGPEPKEDFPGLAVAETDHYVLLAEAQERLICERKSGACQLFDIRKDPAQRRDLSGLRPERLAQMRTRLRQIASTHGRFESEGLRASGQGWPQPIVLGMSGNAEVAPELALLLDDADPSVRRKAAELLFEIGTTAQGPALRLALTREEDPEAQAWIALAITRLGQGAPLVVELLKSKDPKLRRRAALVLAEQGNDLGEAELLAWFMAAEEREHSDALAILKALARLKSKKALYPLIQQLGDVRLRAAIAETLAAIGDKDAKGPLTLALRKERFQLARGPLAQALLDLGAKEELILPLRRFLGVPDPMNNGLGIAMEAGILSDVGGPKARDLRRLHQLSDSGVQLQVIVPPRPKKWKGSELGCRLLLRVRSRSEQAGEIYVQKGAIRWGKKKTFRKRPEISTADSAAVKWDAAELGEEGWTEYRQLVVELPTSFDARPGYPLSLELYANSNLEISALAVVPLAPDLPPPPPEPWEGKKPQD